MRIGFLQNILAKQLKKPDGYIGTLVAILMNKINDHMNQLTLEKIHVQPLDNILEIGFGNGKYFPVILRQLTSGKLIGLDYSETMVKLATNKFQRFILEGKLTVIQGTVSKIPYQDQTFEKVYTVNTIYFWPRPTDDMKEIYRVLKGNGRLILTFRSRDGMREKNGFTLYSVQEVVALAESAGFRNVSVTSAADHLSEMYSVMAIK